MAELDDGFLQFAQPFVKNFFMFNRSAPFGDDFFGGGRVNSTLSLDSTAVRVRNIPIRLVDSTTTSSSLSQRGSQRNSETASLRDQLLSDFDRFDHRDSVRNSTSSSGISDVWPSTSSDRGNDSIHTSSDREDKIRRDAADPLGQVAQRLAQLGSQSLPRPQPPPPPPKSTTSSIDKGMPSVNSNTWQPKLHATATQPNTAPLPPLRTRTVPTFTTTSVLNKLFDNVTAPQETKPNYMLRSVPPPKPNISDARNVTQNSNEDFRKQVNSAMGSSLQTITTANSRLSKVTAARNWRAPHLLQNSLSDLRGVAVLTCEAVDDIVSATARLCVDDRSQIGRQLSQLVTPLRSKRLQLRQLCRALDQSGWSVATMSRTNLNSNDNVDQFVRLVPQISSLCSSLVDWLCTLSPSSDFYFLPTRQEPTAPVHSTRNDVITEGNGKWRWSNDSLSPATNTYSTPSVTTKSDDEPSTESSIGNSSLESNGTPPADDHVMLEDDLESVRSDSNSLIQDYAYLDDVIPERKQTRNPELSAQDERIVRLHAAEAQRHEAELCRAVDDMLTGIELNSSHAEFVHKGKAIILAAHKLIYIGDAVSECVRGRAAAQRLRYCSDDMCCILQNCVASIKTAADEYPNVSATQKLLDNLVSLSQSAHQLREFFDGYA